MADEGGFEVARAFVTVSPDAADFDEQLQEQLGGLHVTVTVDADTAPAQDQMGELGARAEGLQGTYDLNFAANTGAASGGVEALGAQVDDVVGRVRELQIGAGTGDATGTIQSLNAEMDALEATMGKLQAQSEAVTASLAEVGAAGEESAGALAGSSDSVDALIGEYAALSGEFRQFADVAGTAVPELQALGAGFTELGASLAAAKAAGGATAAEVATLQAELAGLGGELDTLEGSFGTSATAVRELGTAAGETTADLGALGASGAQAASFAGLWQTQYAGVADQLENTASGARNAAGALEVSAEDVAALGQDFNVAASEIGQLADRIGDMTPEVAQLQGVASALGADIEAMGTQSGASAAEFESLQMRVGALGGAIDSLEADIPQITADFQALGGAVEVAGLHSTAGMYETATADIENMGAAAASASPQVQGLGSSGQHTAGMFRLLETAVIEAAQSPWTWVAVGTAAVIGLGIYLDQTSTAVQKLADSMAKQDDATGVNLAGYQRLQGQLDSITASTANYGAALEAAGQAGKPLAHNLAGAVEIMPELNAAQQQAATATDNLASHLSDLEVKYGLSQTQAEALASAAHVSATALTGSGTAAGQAMQQIDDYAQANIGARGAVGEMANDMNIFGNAALNASTRIGALNDSYQILVGNFVSSQQATLQVANDFLTFASNAQQAHASMTGTNQASNTLQQSFYAIIPDIENTADAMTKQGDSTQQVTGYISDQIDKLSGLTGGNQEAQQAVEGLKEWEDNLKVSADGANNALAQAARTLENQFTQQVEKAGLESGTAKSDITDLTTAIQNTGTKSTATHAARLQLIADLEASGVKATTAKTDVDNYIASLGRIPKSESTTLNYSARGLWSIQQIATTSGVGAGSGLPGYPGNAAGALLRGGTPGKDSIPFLGEPGELVVPARMVNAGLVDHLRGRIPGFAGGGVVGSYSGPVTGVGQWAYSDWYAQNQSVEIALENAVMSAVGGARSQAFTALMAALAHLGGGGGGAASGAAMRAGATVNMNYFGTQYPSIEQRQAMLLDLTAAISNA
jgi:hypothetical protein